MNDLFIFNVVQVKKEWRISKFDGEMLIIINRMTSRQINFLGKRNKYYRVNLET